VLEKRNSIVSRTVKAFLVIDADICVLRRVGSHSLFDVRHRHANKTVIGRKRFSRYIFITFSKQDRLPLFPFSAHISGTHLRTENARRGVMNRESDLRQVLSRSGFAKNNHLRGIARTVLRAR